MPQNFDPKGIAPRVILKSVRNLLIAIDFIQMRLCYNSNGKQ